MKFQHHLYQITIVALLGLLSVCQNAQAQLFVASNGNGRLNSYDPNTGAALSTGSATGLTGISKVVFGPDGYLYAVLQTSASTSTIVRLLDTGVVDITYKAPAGLPTSISSIAFDLAGRMFVSSSTQGTVVRAGNGTFLSGLQSPSEIFCDASLNLWVAEATGNDIKEFGPDGSLKQTIYLPKTTLGPRGIALDSSNRLYVSLPSTPTILRYTLVNGAYQQDKTYIINNAKLPYNLAVDSANTFLYAADAGTNKVVRYGLSSPPAGSTFVAAGSGATALSNPLSFAWASGLASIVVDHPLQAGGVITGTVSLNYPMPRSLSPTMVSITSNSKAVNVLGSPVSIPSGTLTGTFFLSGNVSNDHLATITATLAGVSRTADVSLVNRDVDFGLALNYDSGKETTVALNNQGTVLEVHRSPVDTGLWYHVGQAANGVVSWVKFGQYDTGYTPAIALNNKNVAVEVHKTGASDEKIWYHVGTVSGNTFNYGSSTIYDEGNTPKVALNDSGVVVEVHRSSGSGTGLYYHVGAVNGSSINWGNFNNYDVGNTPAVAIDNNNNVIEVHREQASSGTALYYRVGTVNPATRTISFGPSTNYDSGWNPGVALTDDGTIVAVHESAAHSLLYSRTGRLINGNIVWNANINGVVGSTYFDTGSAPAVAANGFTAIQTHVDTVSVFPNYLFCSTSLITDRASWMQTNLPVFGNFTLSQITLPGSHDAGMYDNSILDILGQTQDLSLYQQLHEGFRYFDLRPHWDGKGLKINHGIIIGLPVQNMLDDVATFMREGRKELVILKFSHYDNFDNNGVAYKQLASQIQSTLGSWLLPAPPKGTRLLNQTLNQLIGSGGKVLVVMDGGYARTSFYSGIYTYRDSNTSDASVGDLRVFDQYANTTDFNAMVADQQNKFSKYNGICQDNSPCDMFLASWTLTPVTDVLSFSKTANRNLISSFGRLLAISSSSKCVNVIFVDGVEYARATDLCLYMHSLLP